MNPLWWLHLRVGGSAKSNLYLVMAYFGIVLLASTMSYNFLMEERTRSSLGTYYSIWAGIISGAQAIFLLLLVPSAIKRSVQRDYQLGIIETLRLTPLSDSRIVLGYLIGPALPTLMLFGSGLIMGSYFTMQASQYSGLLTALGGATVLSTWWALMGLLAIGATMISSISLLSAVAVREHKFNILGLMVAGAVLGDSVIVLFVPGVTLITGVMGGSVLFSSLFRGTALGDQSALLTAAFLQMLFTLTFLAAAARRYRRSEQPVFTLDLSLVLLSLMGVTLVLGMVHALPTQQWAELQYQLVASLVTFLAVSMFTLNAAASDRLRFDRASTYMRDKYKAAALRRSLIPLLVTVSACALCALMVLVLEPAAISANLKATIEEPYMWAAIALTVLFATWFDYSLLYVGAALRWKTWIILLISWGILRLAPVLVDGWLTEMTREMAEDPEARWLLQDYAMSASPLGIFLLVFRPCYHIGAGLGVQLVLALLAAGMARWVQPKANQIAAPSEPTPVS